jgi:ABC-2 type transport system ATP-binding protein
MIKVEGLSKSYGRKQVLKELSFSVNAGECLAIIGKNGSGKTTLLNIMLDMEMADHGRVHYDNFSNQKRMPVGLKKQIGAFLGDQILIEELSGQEYIDFIAGLYGLKYYQNDLAELREVFQFTDEAAFRREKMLNYSLGMKRKISLISVLLHKPQYLILDEAFSALDYEVVSNFLNLLRKRKPEVHLILTSHILPYLELIMDKVMILEEGELTFYGPKSELDASKLPFLSTSTDPKVTH